MIENKKDNIDKLLAAIRGGSDLETSCHFSSLTVSQVYRWLELGKIESERVEAGHAPDKTQALYVEFWDELKKARADAIIRNVSVVQKATQENWKAAAWWLERTMPEVYGSRAGGTRRQLGTGETPNELPAGKS